MAGDGIKYFFVKPHKLPPAEWAEVQDMHHLFGLKEGLTYKWIRRGLIKTVCVKVDGNAKRGKRLVELASVRKLLASQAGNSPAQAGPGRKPRIAA
jgi:hypothetical protein